MRTLKTNSPMPNFKSEQKKIKKIQQGNELTHPRFEMITKTTVSKSDVSNSLLFLMYSKENEHLFI